MAVMRGFIIGLLFFFVSILQGQDTVRIMHYNLLMYGNYFSGCTSSNNNVEDKNEYLKMEFIDNGDKGRVGNNPTDGS